jgi:hypothetical protein
MVERQDSSQILVTHNGQAFRFNELVHIFEGTALGVRAGKTKFMKAWFKGVDVKSDKFICRPVIGYSRGSFPRFSKVQSKGLNPDSVCVLSPHDLVHDLVRIGGV